MSGPWTPELFQLARKKVGSGAAVGIDGVQQITEAEVEQLRQELLQHRYRPRPLLCYLQHKQRPDGSIKVREIGIPALRDQVLMAALRLVMEPELERRLHPIVWGFRPGRDRFAAVATLGQIRTWQTLVRCDVRDMFPSLDHGALRRSVAQLWPDPVIREVLESWLQVWTRGCGIPMGTSISPLLSNACLHLGVDRWLAAQVQGPTPRSTLFPRQDPRSGYGPGGLRPLIPRGVDPRQAIAPAWGIAETPLRAAVRYADDFALLCADNGRSTLVGLERALGECGLALAPPKTSLHRRSCPEDWPAWVLGIPLAPRASGLLEPEAGPTAPK